MLSQEAIQSAAEPLVAVSHSPLKVILFGSRVDAIFWRWHWCRVVRFLPGLVSVLMAVSRGVCMIRVEAGRYGYEISGLLYSGTVWPVITHPLSGLREESPSWH
jgi:MFS superfamily sulfate permease-like transporter